MPRNARSRVLVTLPNGETRSLEAGPSSFIIKAVLEEFAPRFLADPVVVWVSESGKRAAFEGDALARRIGLRIRPSQADTILADIGVQPIKLVFVEVVATDGAITESRKDVLTKIAVDAGFDPKHLMFVSAFLDRNTSAFKRAVGNLAWNSRAWFAAEPDGVLDLNALPHS